MSRKIDHTKYFDVVMYYFIEEYIRYSNEDCHFIADYEEHKVHSVEKMYDGLYNIIFEDFCRRHENVYLCSGGIRRPGAQIFCAPERARRKAGRRMRLRSGGVCRRPQGLRPFGGRSVHRLRILFLEREARRSSHRRHDRPRAHRPRGAGNAARV